MVKIIILVEIKSTTKTNVIFKFSEFFFINSTSVAQEGKTNKINVFVFFMAIHL